MIFQQLFVKTSGVDATLCLNQVDVDARKIIHQKIHPKSLCDSGWRGSLEIIPLVFGRLTKIPIIFMTSAIIDICFGMVKAEGSWFDQWPGLLVGSELRSSEGIADVTMFFCNGSWEIRPKKNDPLVLKVEINRHLMYFFFSVNTYIRKYLHLWQKTWYHQKRSNVNFAAREPCIILN